MSLSIIRIFILIKIQTYGKMLINIMMHEKHTKIYTYRGFPYNFITYKSMVRTQSSLVSLRKQTYANNSKAVMIALNI